MSTATKPTMLTYVENTPEQLAYNIEHSKELTKTLVDFYVEKGYKNIWIIACGSSNNGCQCAKPFMMKYLGIDVKIVPPNSFIYLENQMCETDLAFVVSQSGCSTNSIEALDKLKAMGHTAIGLTGCVASDFKDHADIVIDWGVGVETVGYVTKGVTTLAQFLMLFTLEAALLKGKLSQNDYDSLIEEMSEAPKRHETIQKETWDFYHTNEKILTSMKTVYTCGFMQGYGIATEAALKIGETIKIPSFSYEAEEYIHGPNLQLTPDYTVFCIDDLSAGSERMAQIYAATRSVTDEAFFISNNPIVDDAHAIRLPFEIKEPLLMPLYVLPVFQILAYQVSNELNSWDNHPMFKKDFKRLANTKTENITKMMPDF